MQVGYNNPININTMVMKMIGEKTGGRQKGTPNKLTFQTRQILVNVINAELCNLPSLLEQLTPSERVEAVCKLSKFALPPLATVSSFDAEANGLVNEEKATAKIYQKHKTEDMFDIGL
jgi:hypothetical protein